MPRAVRGCRRSRLPVSLPATGVGLPVSVACRNLFAGGRVEADASVP